MGCRKSIRTQRRPCRTGYDQPPLILLFGLYACLRLLIDLALAPLCDESGIRSDYHSGTTWAAVGQTPVVKSTGSRFSLNMVSAISAKGSMRFMVVEGRMNGERFIEFLKRLIHNAGRPIFLVVDGHPSHRAKIVAQFVELTEGRLRLFFLPGYSPELNPDEFVWKYVKHQKGSADRHRQSRPHSQGHAMPAQSAEAAGLSAQLLSSACGRLCGTVKCRLTNARVRNSARGNGRTLGVSSQDVEDDRQEGRRQRRQRVAD